MSRPVGIMTRGSNLTPEIIEQARALRRKKISLEAIAAQIGISKSSAHRAVADLKVDRRAAANHARAMIPPPWLDKARQMLREGKSRPKIASDLGVAQTSIYRVLHKFGTAGKRQKARHP